MLRSLGTVLVLAFYALAIWCYLRRGPAVATSDSVTAHAAAIAATWLPFAFPLLPGASPGPGRQALSDVLLICGMAWALWSLRFLDRNVSVLAQARDVVDAGTVPLGASSRSMSARSCPRSVSRIAVNSYMAVALWVALCGLQVYRAVREEQVLLAGFAGLPRLPKPHGRPTARRLLKWVPSVTYRTGCSRWAVLAVRRQKALSFLL